MTLEQDAGGAGGVRSWALLVGIDKYQQDRVPDLRGCVNDVAAMKRILLERFQVPADNIRILTDGDATRENILSTFEQHLIGNVQEGDRVFFHYSGHGSQMRDVSNDEIDARDETIVPHDSRDPEGRVFDISDDELYELVQRLTAATNRAVLVLDCCHSGSATRALTPVRQIPMDEREPPPAPPGRRAIGAGERGPSGLLPADDYVLISGSRDKELSNEHVVTLEDGRTARFGALSYYLVQGLIDAPRDATWGDVMAEVAPQVTALYPAQHPQIEGAIRRRLFGGGVREEDPAFRVTEVSDGTISLSGGVAHGLHRGARVAVYAPDVYRFAGADPIAHGQVVSVGATEASVEVESDAAVPVGARVRLLSPALPQLQLPVVLADGAEALRPALVDNPWIRLTTPDEAEGPIVLRLADGQIHIDAVSGEPIADPLDRDDLALLGERLEHLARFRALMQLKNTDPGSQLNRRVTLRFGARGEDGQLKPLTRNAGGEAIVPVGQELLLEVENRHDAPVYISLLALTGSDFSVQPLYPPPGAQDNELGSGKIFRAGTRGNLKASPPLGQTTVLLIATEQPSDFRSLWIQRMRSVDVEAPAGSLQQFLTRAATRGLTLTAEEPEVPEEDWTAQRVTIHVITSGD